MRRQVLLGWLLGRLDLVSAVDTIVVSGTGFRSIEAGLDRRGALAWRRSFGAN